MAIYTRTGDQGKTSLLNGQRVSKSDLRIEVCGTIDELNSAIGVVLSEIRSTKSEIRNELKRIQSDLLEIGSYFANPTLNHEPRTMNYLTKRVKEFENLIDEMAGKMPVLKNFILPGGGKTGAMLHLSRAVCRRLEREVVELNKQQNIDKNILAYFNRLSDLLFTMARFVNFKEKKKEIIWGGKK